MPHPLIDNATIKAFAEDKVNLPREYAQKCRDQVNRLRERLAHHIAENPGFDLVKMLHAGSVAKGMGLRTINDLDAAVYVKKDTAPISDHELVRWLAARLREANPNLRHSLEIKYPTRHFGAMLEAWQSIPPWPKSSRHSVPC